MPETIETEQNIEETETHSPLFHHQSEPGAVPGTIVGRAGDVAPTIHVIAYGPDELFEETIKSIDQLEERRDRFPVTWINVEGLGDADVISRLGDRFGLHVLAMEDAINTHQRSKVEDYEDHLFVVVRMVDADDCIAPSEPFETEQLAVFVGRDFVLTFQDGRPGDCLEPLRDRIRNARGRVRKVNSGGLAYAIIDTVIDHYFPLVEDLAGRLDAIDDELVSGRGSESISTLHEIRTRLLQLRRVLRPHNEAIHQLIRSETEIVTDDTRLYLRDCHDHTHQLLDAIETCRETCSDLRDAHFTVLSTRQNEVMKTLTIIATLFMPMSFVAGLYGMNFDNMPELHWSLGYPFALATMSGIAIGFLIWFHKRGWFSGA